MVVGVLGVGAVVVVVVLVVVVVVVGVVFPCQGFGDLGYDGLGLGADGHAGDKKISIIKLSFQTCQASGQCSAINWSYLHLI